jgi:hypothetical protein
LEPHPLGLAVAMLVSPPSPFQFSVKPELDAEMSAYGAAPFHQMPGLYQL